MRLFLYANNHGSGHVRRAQHIATEGMARGHEVIISCGETPIKITATKQVLLPDYSDGSPQSVGQFVHYVPQVKQTRQFMNNFTSALHNTQPDVVFTDVSAELTLLTRLLGYKTTTRLMHGERSDTLHQAAYAASDHLFAFYSDALQQDWLQPEHRAKTSFLGMHKKEFTHNTMALATKEMLFLKSLGAGNKDVSTALRNLAAQNPHWTVTALGGHKTEEFQNLRILPTVSKIDQYTNRSSLIICSGGANAVTDALSCGQPMIIVPEPRPFDEQTDFAAQLNTVYGIQVLNYKQLSKLNLDNARREAAESTSAAQIELSSDVIANFWDVIEKLA